MAKQSRLKNKKDDIYKSEAKKGRQAFFILILRGMLTTPNTPLLLPLYSQISLRKKKVSKGRADYLLIIVQIKSFLNYTWYRNHYVYKVLHNVWANYGPALIV